MCFLPNDIEGSVLGILGEVLKEGQPFTGHDIWKRCNAVDKVPAATDIRGVKRGMSDISAFVREQFNQGNMPGWASTQVTPVIGPVLYFKMAPSMKASRIAEQIRTAMREAGTLQE